jgi:hypothetical protein
MHGICGAQDILQKEQYLIQGYFIKHFIFFKAHPLPKEQEVFQYRTKSPRLNLSVFRPRGVPGPTSKLSLRVPAQMGRRETEHKGEQ